MDITHKKGDTFSGTFEVEQSNIPVDLTGYTIKMQLRATPNNPLIAFDFKDSLEIHDPVNGLFQINDVDIDIPARLYYYDIEFTKDGVVQSSETYKFIIIQDITR